mgnify:CR=1 FL=1
MARLSLPIVLVVVLVLVLAFSLPMNLPAGTGRDAFHCVPDCSRKNGDAVERRPSQVQGFKARTCSANSLPLESRGRKRRDGEGEREREREQGRGRGRTHAQARNRTRPDCSPPSELGHAVFGARRPSSANANRSAKMNARRRASARVRLRAHVDSGVKVLDLADPEGPVTERNCAGAIPRGGEQREVNEPSVTPLATPRQGNSIRSAV